ncbi:MAG: tetratricopeptide repeat protein [Candidatus Puniceispirillaceae bacterium]
MKVVASLGTAFLCLVMSAVMSASQPAHAATLAPDAPQTVRDTLSNAHAGDIDSMHRIATYLIGKSVTDDDEMATYAFGWALLAARNGHAQAAELTGVMYRNGIGVTQNYVKSRKWLERALARGSNEANFELAILYADDANPGVDKAKASNFLTDAIKTAEPRACLIAARNKLDEGIDLRRILGELNCAADGDIPEAMELLADYHLAKRSPLSESRARGWLEKALGAGSTTAASKLAALDNQ